MNQTPAPVPAKPDVVPDVPVEVVLAPSHTDALVDAWLREAIGNCPEMSTPTSNRLREAGEALKARLR